MTIPAIVAGHTTAQDTSATTSRTITTPTYSSGDEILIFVAASISSANVAASGFTALPDYGPATLSGGEIWILQKTAGSEGASYTITSASCVVSAIAVAVSNYGGLHAGGTNATGTSATATAPAVSTIVANTLRISVIATDDNPGVTSVATLTGHTLLATVTGSSKPTISVQHKDLTGTGSDGSQTAALSGSETWTGITFAISDVAEARATKAGAYAEIGGTTAAATKAGVYVEIDILQGRVTKAGAYAEIAILQHRITTAGFYLEIDEPCPDLPVYPSEGHTVVIYNGIDITRYCTQADLQALADEVDATNLASDGPETAPGGITWLVNIAGKLTKESDDILGKDAITPPDDLRPLMVVVGAGSRCGTTYSWIGNSAVGAFVSDYKIGPNDPLKETTMWTAILGVSGGPSRAGGKTVAQGRVYL